MVSEVGFRTHLRLSYICHIHINVVTYRNSRQEGKYIQLCNSEEGRCNMISVSTTMFHNHNLSLSQAKYKQIAKYKQVYDKICLLTTSIMSLWGDFLSDKN